MIDREPPNADKRGAQASARRFCAASRAGSSSSEPCLARRNRAQSTFGSRHPGNLGYSAFFSPSHPMNGWTVGAARSSKSRPRPARVGSSVWGLGPHRGGRQDDGQDRRRRAGQRRLVDGRRRAGPSGWQTLFNVPRGAFLQLQFRPRLVRQLGANHHRRLGYRGTKWTVPVGTAFGRIIKLGGKLPVKLSLGAYYNVVTPQYGAKWQIQSVVAVIF